MRAQYLPLLIPLLVACGGSPSNGESWGDAVPLLTDLDRPVTVVADDTHIYLAEIDLSDDNGCHIFRIPRTGGTTEPLHEQMSGILALAIDEEGVYFIDTASVSRLDKTNLDVTELHSEGNGDALVARDGRLYWWFYDSGADEGQIHTMGTDGTDHRVIGRSAGRPDGGLGIDETHIYWGVPSTGEVLGVARDGESAEPQVIAADQCSHGVAVDDAFVYWHHDESCYLTEGVELRRVPHSNDPSLIETAFDNASPIAQGDDGVYFTDGMSLYRATLPTPPSLGRFSDLGCEDHGAMTTCPGPTALFVDSIGALLVGWTGREAGSGWLGSMARP